jgi:hypothetical protein
MAYKIAFVRPTFTEAAYQVHGFYTFYFKYKFPPFGKKITTDLDMLTVKTPKSVSEEQDTSHLESNLRHFSNVTALIPFSPDQKSFWMPFVNHVIGDVSSNSTVTVMRDEDVNDGHIFNSDNKTNAYDPLLLFHNEYVTQKEYDNLKRFVSNGGTLENFIRNNVTFTNNPFNYKHFEEEFANNPNDKIIIDYGIKYPKYWKRITDNPVATYTLNYGKGRVITIGLTARHLAHNERSLNFFDDQIIPRTLCPNLSN